MRSRKIISIMAIALTVVITSCTIGDTAYAAEIQNTQSINTEVKLNSKTNSEFAKTLKIVDSNISFNEGYYSFNKTNAIKQGLSAANADSVVECINEVNSQIENGMLKVSADGKNVIANSNSNNFNINKDSKIMTSSYDDDDYDVIYEGYLSVDACNAIGDDLNDGATWIGLACTLAIWCPAPWVKVAAKFGGLVGAVSKAGGSSFKRAARNGGKILVIKKLRYNDEIVKAFLR